MVNLSVVECWTHHHITQPLLVASLLVARSEALHIPGFANLPVHHFSAIHEPRQRNRSPMRASVLFFRTGKTSHTLHHIWMDTRATTRKAYLVQIVNRYIVLQQQFDNGDMTVAGCQHQRLTHQLLILTNTNREEDINVNIALCNRHRKYKGYSESHEIHIKIITNTEVSQESNALTHVTPNWRNTSTTPMFPVCDALQNSVFIFWGRKWIKMDSTLRRWIIYIISHLNDNSASHLRASIGIGIHTYSFHMEGIPDISHITK